MALTKLSTIADKATALAGTERIEVLQGGATKYTDPAQIVEISDEFLQGIRQLGSVALGRTLSLGPPSVTLTLIDGRCQLVACFLKKPGTVTGVKFIQLTQGNYTADNNNRIGLYTVSAGVLTLVASSANNGDLWKGAAGTITVPFDVPYVATAGVYYVGYIYNSSAQVTAPTIAGTPQVSVGGLNMDLANSNMLAGYKAGTDIVASTTPMSDFSANYIPGFFLLY